MCLTEDCRENSLAASPISRPLEAGLMRVLRAVAHSEVDGCL